VGDEKRERREKKYYDGSRSPHTRRSRCARVTPRRATHVIHAMPINMMAKSVRSVARHRQETGLLDVKMTSYERSYHPRFNQRRSCTTASALQPPRKESVKMLFSRKDICTEPQIPFGDQNRTRPGAAPPVCGSRADESRALLGCVATLRAHRRSEGRSCAACLGLHDGISAGDSSGVSRCMCLADRVQGEGESHVP